MLDLNAEISVSMTGGVGPIPTPPVDDDQADDDQADDDQADDDAD